MPHLQAELIPAMVTPFHRDESIDFEKAEQLAVYLAENGCDGILVNGTTGESPTLSFEEKLELLKVVKSAVRGRNVQIVAGVGSNDTAKSVEEARKVAALGVDALLVVVPYYNKPSQAGMIEHFRRVAQAVDTEVVVYNIPSRSVVLMSPDTMATLHQQCPNIMGVKQSHPDMDQVSEITAKLPADTWRTWCGDDTLTLPMMACGAHGTFSVLAHLTGPLLREMIQAVKAQEMSRALKLHLKQLNLGREIFFLPNPTVIKTCLARLGMLEPVLRAPMVLPDEAEMARIEQLLAEYKSLMPQSV
ncbi:4-hydroxy-tetrahydrodipicolinate synthase [Vampirovibrio chlorellavorus]|uniref:4-hydroxy-tetrahydrodipicolinate synthase n=1 Tax=Vampirovibrio chlorellavorus TaxID=758823 RepID=UPI0026F0FE15|nr:4-hydroxy-tetrahydrodipicolinate synthase [Vampirovibrio chlorellavorus]